MRISDWSSDVCASDLLRPFERLLIETTGLADPAPILHTLMADPVVGSHYRLDGVVTTVDAVNGDSTLDNHEESVRQAAMADRLLLTKTDHEIGRAAVRESWCHRLEFSVVAGPLKQKRQ